MSSWQDYLDGVNPIDTVRGRHEELMKQRQAENLARMQAANPGYGQGGFGNIQQQQFTQYGPPTLHDNSAEWLQTQRNLYGENIDYNQTGPNAGALSNGQGGQDDQSGRGIGPQGNTNADPYAGMDADVAEAMRAGAATLPGGIPSGLLAGITARDPFLGALLMPFKQNLSPFNQETIDDMKTLQGMADEGLMGLDAFSNEYGQIGTMPEATDYEGVGIPQETLNDLFGLDEGGNSIGPAGPIGPSGPTRGPHAGEGTSSGGTGTGRSGGDAGEGGGTGQGGTGNAGGPSGQY